MLEYKVLHLFAGIGGGALGFQEAISEYKGLVGKFRALAGVDVDPLACQDFENLTGALAVQMDLFKRQDYKDFHAHEPPEDWSEVTPHDLYVAVGREYPDIVFLSPPCKGFSGLLPSKSAASSKYQALNRLVVRSMDLTMKAFAEDLPSAILIENVPRITTRGAELLKQVKKLLAKYGYVFNEATYDCGEVGGLGQRRKRYLLIARNQKKMPAFIYQPPAQRLKSIGEVIGPIPTPDDPTAGPMHRLPRLQWKTWVRLALIPAGGDWRDLQDIKPEQYCIEHVPRDCSFGVQAWDEPSNTVTGNMRVGGSSASAIPDPRLNPRDSRHGNVHQITKWDESSNCVTGTRFGSGAPAAGDVRVDFKESTHHAIYRISKYDEPGNTVTGAHRPNNGALCIADPKVRKQGFSNCYQLHDWDETAATVTGIPDIQSGAQSIADPRLSCSPRSGTMGVQAWDEPGKTVIGAGDIHAGATAVADPRIPKDTEQGTWVIIAPDGTWHRPLTTLELAALQGFSLTLSDGSPLTLTGKSDARWREAIGNAVPPPAARAIAEQILPSLMASTLGEWFLGATGIWVIPYYDSEEGEIHASS